MKGRRNRKGWAVLAWLLVLLCVSGCGAWEYRLTVLTYADSLSGETVRLEYGYDADGTLASVRREMAAGTEEISYYYNEDGLLSRLIRQGEDADGGGIELQYNDQGQNIRTDCYDPAGELLWYVTKAYGEERISTLWYSSADRSVSCLLEYRYGTDGRLEGVWVTLSREGQREENQYWKCGYDGGLLVKAEKYSRAGDQWTQTSDYLEFAYDSAGNRTEAVFYRQDGEVCRCTMEYGRYRP